MTKSGKWQNSVPLPHKFHQRLTFPLTVDEKILVGRYLQVHELLNKKCFGKWFTKQTIFNYLVSALSRPTSTKIITLPQPPNFIMTESQTTNQTTVKEFLKQYDLQSVALNIKSVRWKRFGALKYINEDTLFEKNVKPIVRKRILEACN